MRNRITLLGMLATAFALMLVTALPSGAADLHFDHVGTSCPDGYVGVWHLVNNQTDGAAPGSVVVDTGDGYIVHDADKTNRNTQHFWIMADARVQTLVDAHTYLPGKLVLSEYYCVPDKKEPPKDDPKDPKKG